MPRLDSAQFENAAGKRLDVFLAGALEKSRAHIQQLLKEGLVKKEGLEELPSAKYHLRTGDVFLVEEKVRVVSDKIIAENIPLEILYEDDEVIVINKPPGLVVHPAVGHAGGTLVNALLYHCGEKGLAQRGGVERLGIVHRLDKETSGAMVVAKTDSAHEKLGHQFQTREVKKMYVALVKGRLRRASGKCEGRIGRHRVHRQKMAIVKTGGRDALTQFKLVKQWHEAAMVECELHTGRTHQIRVHLAELGHPIIGDNVYGRPAKFSAFAVPDRQMLHAQFLSFLHPRTGKRVEFKAPLPEDFSRIVNALNEPVT